MKPYVSDKTEFHRWQKENEKKKKRCMHVLCEYRSKIYPKRVAKSGQCAKHINSLFALTVGSKIIQISCVLSLDPMQNGTSNWAYRTIFGIIKHIRVWLCVLSSIPHAIFDNNYQCFNSLWFGYYENCLIIQPHSIGIPLQPCLKYP